MKICTFASGSSGNCTFVESGGERILIDAGISMRRIKQSLLPHGITPDGLGGILITHEHSDHVAGLKMLLKYYPGIKLYCTAGTAASLTAQLPEAEDSLTVFSAGDGFSVGNLGVTSFKTPHDTPESVGYSITDGVKTLAFATDLGYVSKTVFDAVRGADFAVLEANHDLDMLKNGSYPYYLKQRILANSGHLSNNDCAVFAAALLESGTRQIVLAHLSRENNTPGKAQKTVGTTLESAGAKIGEDIGLSVAPANETGPCYII